MDQTVLIVSTVVATVAVVIGLVRAFFFAKKKEPAALGAIAVAAFKECEAAVVRKRQEAADAAQEAANAEAQIAQLVQRLNASN